MTPTAPGETAGLVGRGAEIDVLQSFIERAGLSGEALVLVGDAGVGKTALLDVAARRAISLGVSVVRAAGGEFEAEISFSALHQLLLPLLDGIEELRPLYRDALSVALGLGEGRPPDRLVVSGAALELVRRAGRGAAALDRAGRRVLARSPERGGGGVRVSAPGRQPRRLARRAAHRDGGLQSASVSARAARLGRGGPPGAGAVPDPRSGYAPAPARRSGRQSARAARAAGGAERASAVRLSGVARAAAAQRPAERAVRVACRAVASRHTAPAPARRAGQHRRPGGAAAGNRRRRAAGPGARRAKPAGARRSGDSPAGFSPPPDPLGGCRAIDGTGAARSTSRPGRRAGGRASAAGVASGRGERPAG